jgi:hypothetical protein
LRAADEGRTPETGAHADRPWHHTFWREDWFVVLALGTVVWLFCSAVTGLTGDPILVPSVILIGSFLAPMAVIAFALSRLDHSLAGTYIGIVVLHGAWDASTGWAILASKGMVEGNWVIAWPNTEEWIGLPTERLLLMWQIVYDGLLILISLIGVSWVVHKWRHNPNTEAIAPA